MPDDASGRFTSSTPVTSEVRIGLAMSGAIALVLYEAGVTHEVFRLLKGWDAFSTGQAPMDDPWQSPPDGYLECFGRIPIRPVVDVLTGASAGGVNSTLLASCLAAGEDFTKYHDILIDELGVEALRYTSGSAPTSLMDSRILLGVLQRELEQNAALAATRTTMAPDLCVRLCRTHLAGHSEITRDAIGHEIDVETRSDVIEFSGEDFARPDRVEAIARAALATAAFPGAFPPVQDAGIWYVDGGLWDNQPIDWAVQAVIDKPNFLPTDRCILFVEPNPPQRPPTVPCAAPEPEPSLAQILMAIPFMGVKGNIWPAVESLLNHNRRGAIYRQLVGNADLQRTATQLGAQARESSERQLRECTGFDAALRDGTWQRSAPEAPTILNQVRIELALLDNDAALVQRWRAMLESWNALALRLPVAARALGFDAGNGTASDPGITTAHKASVAALQAIGTYDLERRAVRRRLEEVNVQPGPLDAADRAALAREAAPANLALYARLEQLNRYLCDKERTASSDCAAYHSQLVRYHSRFRAASLAMLEGLETAFRKLLLVPAQAASDKEAGALVSAILADPATNPLLILAAWIETVRAEAAAAEASTGVRDGVDEADLGPESRWESVRLFFHQRRAEETARAPEAAVLQEAVPDPAARVGFAEVTDLDIARHVLAAISDLTGRKPMDLIRVSPNDTYNLYLLPARPDRGGTAAAWKLAGEGLGHLQGFMESRWRRNDYVWGRLDACEILLRTMRLYGERRGFRWPEAEYEDALYRAQQAILRQEAALYALWLRRNHKAEIPELSAVGAVSRAESRAEQGGGVLPAEARDLAARRRANARIVGFGGEMFLDADEPAFTNNVNYLLQTTVRLLQGDAKDPPYALGRLARLSRVVSYPVRWVAALAPPFREAPRAGNVWKWTAFLLIAMSIAGAAGWGIGAKRDLMNMLAAALYTALAAVALIALGCVLGYRRGFATVVAFVAGIALGAGVAVWRTTGLRSLVVPVAGWHVPLPVVVPLAAVLLIGILAVIEALLARIPRLR